MSSHPTYSVSVSSPAGKVLGSPTTANSAGGFGASPSSAGPQSHHNFHHHAHHHLHQQQNQHQQQQQQQTTNNSWLHSNKLRRLYNSSTGRANADQQRQSGSRGKNRGKYFGGAGNAKKSSSPVGTRRKSSRVDGGLYQSHDLSENDSDNNNNSDNNNSDESSDDDFASYHHHTTAANNKNNSNNSNTGNNSNKYANFQIGEALSNLLYGRSIDSTSGPASQRTTNAGQINSLMIANLDSSLKTYMHRGERSRYDSSTRLLDMERGILEKELKSILESRLSNSAENSKVLKDILRRQGGQGNGVSSRFRGGRRSARGSDDNGEDDDESSGDDLHHHDGENGNDDDDPNNSSRRDREDGSNNGNQKGSSSSPERGANHNVDDGFVEVGGRRKSAVVPAPMNNSPARILSPTSRSPSPASGRNNNNNNKLYDDETFVPSIMKGLKVDLTKQAEQAQHAKQQLLDTRKSLAYDSRHMLQGAVHSSHDCVKKYAALFTHQQQQHQKNDEHDGHHHHHQPSTTTAIVPHLPETNIHSSRARGITSKSSRGSSRGSKNNRKPLGAHKKVRQSSPGNNDKNEDGNDQQQRTGTASSSVSAKEKKAVEYLFMTECRSPAMNGIVVAANKKNASDNKKNENDHDDDDSLLPPPLDLNNTLNTNGGQNNDQIKTTGLTLIPSPPKTSRPTSTSNNNNHLVEFADTVAPSPSNHPLRQLTSFIGNNNNNDDNNNNNNNMSSSNPTSSNAIEELLMFDRRKNVDLHHQNYRPHALTARQPKLPPLLGTVGSAKKVRKFINRVNTSAVEHGRHGIREFSRAWHAQQEFREERKKVMNELLDDHKLQFMAPQALLLQVRSKMKAVASSKDHKERLDYFFDHINKVRPFIAELFPDHRLSRSGRLHSLGGGSNSSGQQSGHLGISAELNPAVRDFLHQREKDIREQKRKEEQHQHETNNNNNAADDPDLEKKIASTATNTPATNNSPSSSMNLQQQQEKEKEKDDDDENKINKYSPESVLRTKSTMLSALGDIAHKFLDELQKAIIENDGLNNGLSQLDDIAFPNVPEEDIFATAASLVASSRSQYSNINTNTNSGILIQQENSNTNNNNLQQQQQQQQHNVSITLAGSAVSSPAASTIGGGAVTTTANSPSRRNNNNSTTLLQGSSSVTLPGVSGGLRSQSVSPSLSISNNNNNNNTVNNNNNSSSLALPIPPIHLGGAGSTNNNTSNQHPSFLRSSSTSAIGVVDQQPRKVFDNEHIHLENVVNLLALVAPLFGASQEEFGQWVIAKRKRHENRDKAVAVQVAKSAFSSSNSDKIDAHFTLSVYSVKGVWRGVGNLNRAKAYLRFTAEGKVLVSTARAPLKACNWGDDCMYNVSLKDHHSTVLVQLIGEGESIISSGTFNVDGVGWKRLQPITVEMNGVSNCVCHLAVEMDFPHVLSSTVRKKTQMLGSLPQPGDKVGVSNDRY